MCSSTPWVPWDVSNTITISVHIMVQWTYEQVIFIIQGVIQVLKYHVFIVCTKIKIGIYLAMTMTMSMPLRMHFSQTTVKVSWQKQRTCFSHLLPVFDIELWNWLSKCISFHMRQTGWQSKFFVSICKCVWCEKLKHELCDLGNQVLLLVEQWLFDKILATDELLATCPVFEVWTQGPSTVSVI